MAGSPTMALAGTVVSQKVSYSGKSGPAEEKFLWHIGDSGFRLDTSRGNESRSFVFNGRVFYACGKLDKPQLEFIKKLNIKDQTLMKSLETGVCQELSADFSLRFLLSPYEAVGNVDMVAGLGSTLSITDSVSDLSGSVGQVGSTKCVNFKRTYKLTDRSQPKYARTVSETPCNAPTIKWRQSFSRQIGMSLIRSPGGQPTFQALNTDVKTVAGFSLTTEGQVQGTNADGVALSSGFSVTASDVKTEDISTAALGLPNGYQVIDAQNLAALGATNQVDSGGKGSGSAGSDAGSLVKFLILGGNPAAALGSGVAGALRDDGKKKKDK